MSDPTIPPPVAPPTPLSKSVSFQPVTLSSSLPSPTGPPSSVPLSRRRSSLKEGVPQGAPYMLEKELYSHKDPLLRRLRIRDNQGKRAGLERVFQDVKVVVFLFGATWLGSSSESFDVVERFAKRYREECRVVYVSVDTSERSYESNTRGKAWCSMEWHDGSNMSEPTTPTLPPASQEPFLLASDSDLESDISLSDTLGTLYLRPFSRVFLAQKLGILGVPALAVYHVGKGEVVGNARIESLKGDRMEGTWEKWEKGESVEYSLGDFVHALRWTLGMGVAAAAYVVAVKFGGAEDLVGKLSRGGLSAYFGL